LADNPVYQAKRKLIDDHQIVVWRFHDYWHSHQPDGIYIGLIKQLGWQEYSEPGSGLPIFNIPLTTVGNLANELKEKLGAKKIRVVGDLEMPCKKIVFMVGAVGPEFPIHFSSKFEPVDALVCG
jgi:hypothetical protein